MPILLSEDASLGVVYEELYYTLTMARLNPEASALLPDAEALCKACLGMQSRERSFAESLMHAENRVGQVGRNLLRFLDKVEPTLSDALAGKESTVPARLFAGRTTSLLKAQVAAGEVDALRDWPELLEEAGQKPLMDLARELRALLTASENARNALADAKLRATDFRSGARRAFWDTCNAKRRDAHRLLSKIAAEKAALGPEFVSLFFRAGLGELPSEETIERRLQVEIAELSGRLTDRQAQLDSLRAQREAELRHEAEQRQEAEKKREAEAKRSAPAAAGAARRGRTERPASPEPSTAVKAPSAPAKPAAAPAKAPASPPVAPAVASAPVAAKAAAAPKVGAAAKGPSAAKAASAANKATAAKSAVVSKAGATGTSRTAAKATGKATGAVAKPKGTKVAAKAAATSKAKKKK